MVSVLNVNADIRRVKAMVLRSTVLIRNKISFLNFFNIYLNGNFGYSFNHFAGIRLRDRSVLLPR